MSSSSSSRLASLTCVGLVRDECDDMAASYNIESNFEKEQLVNYWFGT